MTAICIVGTGHVGLMYGVAFALGGYHVAGVDVDAKTIQTLQRGTPMFYEPGLEAALTLALRTKRLVFSEDVIGAARSAEVVFLCVGTPSRPDGSTDLTFLEAAARTVGEALRSTTRYHVVAVKSTVVPGASLIWRPRGSVSLRRGWADRRD